MKKIYLIISSIVLALLLSACGSGEGNYTSDTESVKVIACDNNNSAIAMNDCGNVSIPNYYTCVTVGSTLVSDDTQTVYELVENAYGIKKVCTKSGAAHILRDK